MFLKKIEMQGFKSFADKTTIIFEKGVTAVVGPNGSGKSNITESLRWALGESSAKSLRGGKMPDIIFAGTESRHALNFAQVAVVLDNSDHFIKEGQKEIRVERHIYRNGDSDYLINGKKVRLRDIHDLFMDTGLGRDSFSIISQGRVEEIFNSKPEERRAIFEEAAGVLKYKTRKKETQSKLNQTQDNLDRLDDIIYELENQVLPLEKQAKTAKEFQNLEARRKQLHLDLLVNDIESDKKNLDKTDQLLADLKVELNHYYEHRKELATENQSLKQKKQALSLETETKQGDLLEATKLVSDLERQIDLIRLETSQKNEKKEEAQARLEGIEKELLQYEREKEDKDLILENLDQDLATLQAKIEELKDDLLKFSEDPDHLIENLRDDFVNLMQKEAQLSNKRTSLLSDIDKLSQDQKDKEEEEEVLRAKLAGLEKSCQEAQQFYQEKVQELKDLISDFQRLEAKGKEEELSYQKNQDKLFEILNQKKSKEARRDSLEAIQKSHSQFYAGVRAVLQSSAKIGGILGAVSEHLSFKQEYQVALEIALAASSQHIIVEDEAAAKRGIAFLKNSRQGRATFLPLTTIKARSLSDHYLHVLESCQGFLGSAESLVTYDKHLSTIFKNLLSTTLIFDTIDNANGAAKRLDYKVRIITLDGTELRPGGSFSGGATRHNNTTFIKPELDQIQEEILTLTKALKEQEELVSLAKSSLEQVHVQVDLLKKEGEEARMAEQKAQLHYQQLKESLDDSKDLLAMMTVNHKDSLLTQYQADQASLEEELQLIFDKKAALTREIDSIKENKDSIKDRQASLGQALSEAQLKERDLANERKFEASNLARLKEAILTKAKAIEELESLLTNQISQEDISRLPSLESRLEEVRKKKEQIEQYLVQLRYKTEDYQALLEELESKISAEHAKNEDFIRKQTKLEADLEQISGRLRAYAKQLSEDFQLSFEEAKEASHMLEELELARQDLKELQKKIKALGAVNLDAISQYQEVAERLDFLNGQKADLNKARNLLLDTISSMDNEVKARFKVTFEAIRESFRETFSQMFGGGSADLILTESDLLSAGVEISVQPPGKKIQSLNLMSGGEKALSALALLFAIIRVKTIPFVILDEVEAALDEANVKRFGNYLNRFDKNSQFIVVTHRKGTMAAADSIYGITMQESGVSKIVSVKLKESEELSFLN
ncbi:chromosome segregation protein SMC [Streptococcus didelphis]|uniref:chromosome segregation protein SMC n=1 Tax=Streptococcus didelphis TaxID=102886 RepID=UPI000370FB70|nr:chromosome segregation protein SMC [Streptococcus didelphis]